MFPARQAGLKFVAIPDSNGDGTDNFTCFWAIGLVDSSWRLFTLSGRFDPSSGTGTDAVGEAPEVDSEVWLVVVGASEGIECPTGKETGDLKGVLKGDLKGRLLNRTLEDCAGRCCNADGVPLGVRLFATKVESGSHASSPSTAVFSSF